MVKYALTDLIKSLNTEEIRNFKMYISRTVLKKGEKKILILFDAIIQNEHDEYEDALMLSLFEAGNKNAFYRLKNRLREIVEHSLLMLHRTKDERFRINNNISLARICVYKLRYEQAFAYLEKAEKEATKGEYFGLLHLIYDHIIELSLQNHKIDAEKYVQKRKANDKKYQVSQQLNSVLAIINNQLFASNFSGKDESIIEQLENIIKEWEFTEIYQNSVKIQFQIHACVRDALLQKKDFEALENYLMESLLNFEQKKLFNKANFQRKIVLLSWIINTLTKNKKFESALQYAEKLHQTLVAFDSLYYDKYIWIYYQSQIINYSFLNKNKQVVELLQELKNNEKLKKQSFYHLFIYLNLATTYYSMNDLENAVENLNEIVNTDIYNSLSVNWKLNLLIVEVIFMLEKETMSWRHLKDFASTGDTAFPALAQKENGAYILLNYSSDIQKKDKNWIKGQIGKTYIYMTEMEVLE